VIATVLREKKTVSAVRSFICIYKLRKFAADAGNIHDPHSPELRHDARNDSFSALEQEEVGKTFDCFDLDRNGLITVDEIQKLMLSLGAPIMESTLRTIVRRLDRDGDGEISRHEFLQWYAESISEQDDLSEHERAKFLFSLFDRNNSGEITIQEFKTKLDALYAGFTVDEVGAIVNELDVDNNGSIGLEEFELLLHKYNPRELGHGTRASARLSLE
jgi:Ca2+-binding EF-hand superfamily protein